MAQDSPIKTDNSSIPDNRVSAIAQQTPTEIPSGTTIFSQKEAANRLLFSA